MQNKSWIEEWERWADNHFSSKEEDGPVDYVGQILKRTEEEMMESQKFEQEQEDMGRGEKHG